MNDQNQAVLCGDIGGTNTRLALAQHDGSMLAFSARRQYANASVASLAECISDFLNHCSRPTRACLAIAGPTDGRVAALTNLPWQIDADEISRDFGFPTRLINDFEAVGWGLDALGPQHLHTLQSGEPISHAPRVALGPGTGLGVALSVWSGNGYRPMPGEGGHIGLAPTDADQADLLQFLQNRFGRVSVERILSGPGIVDLYAYCRAASGLPEVPEADAAGITQAALANIDADAVHAMKLFCRILGQTAGDLALVAGARAGIYIAGGIPPRILPLLDDGELIAGLRDKGRFSEWVSAVPVQVVTDPDLGLKGAALAR